MAYTYYKRTMQNGFFLLLCNKVDKWYRPIKLSTLGQQFFAPQIWGLRAWTL